MASDGMDQKLGVDTGVAGRTCPFNTDTARSNLARHAAAPNGVGRPPGRHAAARPRTARRAHQPLAADGRGSPVSPADLLEHVDVEGLLGEQLLESLILPLELLKPFGVFGFIPY
jgi:hypothetical protein